jgi:hypothetical protein
MDVRWIPNSYCPPSAHCRPHISHGDGYSPVLATKRSSGRPGQNENCYDCSPAERTARPPVLHSRCRSQRVGLAARALEAARAKPAQGVGGLDTGTPSMGKRLFRAPRFPRCPPRTILQSPHDSGQSLTIEWPLFSHNVRSSHNCCDAHPVCMQSHPVCMLPQHVCCVESDSVRAAPPAREICRQTEGAAPREPGMHMAVDGVLRLSNFDRYRVVTEETVGEGIGGCRGAPGIDAVPIGGPLSDPPTRCAGPVCITRCACCAVPARRTSTSLSTKTAVEPCSFAERQQSDG